MNTEIENEVIGEIDGEIFTQKLREFTEKIGTPKRKKRIGLMIFDKNNPNIDTRIRITNGQAEIVQKITKESDASGHTQREEMVLDIGNNTESVIKAFRMYTNLLEPTCGKTIVKLLVQTENYLWKTDQYELKISHQFGKNSYYTFEIEALVKECDVKAVQSSLGLKSIANHASAERGNFRATQVDLNADELNEQEIKAILDTYF